MYIYLNPNQFTNMAKEELIQLELTEIQNQALFDLLSSKEAGRTTLGKMADMIDLRNKLKDNKDVTISRNQFNELYIIVTKPNLEWPINEDFLKLYNKLKYIKEANQE